MYLGGLGAYYLKNGQPTSSYQVGDTMGFNVPGYSEVWLTQTQNGNPQYNGPFTVPMAPYVLQARDVGRFAATVYEYKNGQQGKLIGTDTAEVFAAPAQATVTAPTAQTIYAPPTIQATQAPAYTQGAAPSSGSALLPSGVSTPSLPAPSGGGPIIIPAPSGPIDLSAPVETSGGIDTAPVAAGMDSTTMLLLAGAALFFLFGSRRR